MKNQTPCPHCGDVALVRHEHTIQGADVRIAFYCGYCEYSWSSVDPPVAPPLSLVRVKVRSHSFGRKRPS